MMLVLWRRDGSSPGRTRSPVGHSCSDGYDVVGLTAIHPVGYVFVFASNAANRAASD
jgi:hypothetical protein